MTIHTYIHNIRNLVQFPESTFYSIYVRICVCCDSSTCTEHRHDYIYIRSSSAELPEGKQQLLGVLAIEFSDELISLQNVDLCENSSIDADSASLPTVSTGGDASQRSEIFSRGNCACGIEVDTPPPRKTWRNVEKRILSTLPDHV